MSPFCSLRIAEKPSFRLHQAWPRNMHLNRDSFPRAHNFNTITTKPSICGYPAVAPRPNVNLTPEKSRMPPTLTKTLRQVRLNAQAANVCLTGEHCHCTICCCVECDFHRFYVVIQIPFLIETGIVNLLRISSYLSRGINESTKRKVIGGNPR